MSITWMGTILVVENSLSELELVSHYFRDKNYKVFQASRAKEALEIVLEEKPDIIVIDLVMPGMSGFELCRFLYRNPTNQKTPIVICCTKNQTIDQSLRHQLQSKPIAR